MIICLDAHLYPCEYVCVYTCVCTCLFVYVCVLLQQKKQSLDTEWESQKFKAMTHSCHLASSKEPQSCHRRLQNASISQQKLVNLEVLSLGPVIMARHSYAPHVVSEGWSPTLHFELEVHLFPFFLNIGRVTMFTLLADCSLRVQ